MKRPTQSLTTTYTGITRTIQSKVHVSAAVDIATHPQPITPQNCNAVEFIAIWDTGATNTVISQRIAQDCGLKPISMAKVNTANGERLSPVYLVSMFLPNHVYFPQLRATEGTIVGGDVLIGMDIITRGDFAITNSDGRTTFSYRWPSTSKIDFVAQTKVSGVPQMSKAAIRVGRNDPCPCGSGKKYKKCHGR